MNQNGSTMRVLRQRRNLDADNTSQDDDIIMMPPAQKVMEAVEWLLGDRYWAYRIAAIMKDAECGVDELIDAF